jgi:hypothetical protein
MLACSVAIPVLAIWGASWTDIAKKFQNIHCPTILNLASAAPATAASASEAPPFTPGNLSAQSRPTPVVAPPLPLAPAATAKAAVAPTNCREIQDRLERLGATHYVLESWGNDQQLYRFCCTMAVAGNADYVHCFEATHSDPLRAMQQVLQQIETWREGQRCGG